uniref:Uncharacterized protein n=1 Tax=Anopheles farauti TaxID=69004 RepID=A0A182QXD7_9DIPT
MPSCIPCSTKPLGPLWVRGMPGLIVDSRVAASGECGGGLGAVAPAVGEDGPQQVATATVLPAVVDLLLAAVAVAAAGESPTTSISSSSSTSSPVVAGVLCGGLLSGATVAGVLQVASDPFALAALLLLVVCVVVAVVVSSSCSAPATGCSSARSGHG